MAFVVGGFNEKQGVLNCVESFNLESKTWRKHSNMNIARIAPGCCVFKRKFLYVFGGRGFDDQEDYYDSIEKLDPELNLWSYVKIKLPRKLSNLFAFPVKKDYIMVLGGVKSVYFDKKLNREYEKEIPKERLNSKNVIRVEKIDKNVYLFSQSKQSWHCLKPLSEKMKVCNVIPSGDFRFNCFLL